MFQRCRLAPPAGTGMSEFPSLPLFVDAYLADTSHLSDAEHGRYLKLLMLLWRTPGCRIPNDDAWIAHKLGRSIEQVKSEIRPLIREFCSSTGNYIVQRRLLKEREYVETLRQKNSVAAKSRWHKQKRPSECNAPIPIPIQESTLPRRESESEREALKRLSELARKQPH